MLPSTVIRPGAIVRAVWVLALVLQLCAARPVLSYADEGDMFLGPPASESIGEQVFARLHAGIQKRLAGVAARLSSRDDIELTITRCEMDARHRVFVDLKGEVEIQFPGALSRAAAVMDDLAGHRLISSGPVVIDLTVVSVEQSGERSYTVGFQATLVILLEKVLSGVAQVAGLVASAVLGGQLVGALESVSPDLVADSVATNLKDVRPLLDAAALTDAPEVARGAAADRSPSGSAGARAVVTHLAQNIMRAVWAVGANHVAVAAGGAAGAALLPGMGGAVGAAAGVLGVVLAGNYILNRITVGHPVGHNLRKIRDLDGARQVSTDPDEIARLSHRIEKAETRIVKGVKRDLRVDNFRYLDEVVKQVGLLPRADRAGLAGLKAKLRAILAFEGADRGDRLFAMKITQLEETFAR